MGGEEGRVLEGGGDPARNIANLNAACGDKVMWLWQPRMSVRLLSRQTFFGA